MSQDYQLENNVGNTIPLNDGADAVKDCAYITIGGNHSSRVCDIVTKISQALSDFEKTNERYTFLKKQKIAICQQIFRYSMFPRG